MDARGDYDYESESLIADELKCAICHRPFDSPVDNNACEHTFCRACITTWLFAQQTCPTCRRRMFLADLRPVTSRIVLSMLDRMRVRCTSCHERDIERSNFGAHQQRCGGRIVPCAFADLSCAWTGKVDARHEHESACPLRSVRPIVEELRSQNRRLQQTVQQQAEQIRFLTIRFNNGQSMSTNCVRDEYCRVFSLSPNDPECTMCHRPTSHIHIAYHHCDGGCLCSSCSRLHGL